MDADRHGQATHHLGVREVGLGIEQVGELTDEERVAGAACVDRVDDGVRGAAPDRLLDEPAGVLWLDAAEAEAGGRPPAGDRRDRPHRDIVAGDRDARRHDEQEAALEDPPGEELGELQRRHIRPLDVIEDEHPRPPLARRFEQLGHRLEQLEATRIGCARKEILLTGASEQPVEQLLHGGVGKRPHGFRHRSQHRQPRPERRGRADVIAAAPEHVHTLGDGLLGEVVDQARLADPGLTLDQRPQRPAAEHACQRLGEDAPLRLPADDVGLEPDDVARRVDGEPPRLRRRPGGPRAEQRGILVEDLHLELAHHRARIHAELVEQPLAQVAQHAQRIRLSARAVERDGKTHAGALAQRVGGDELGQLVDRAVVEAEGQLGLYPVLDGAEPPLLEAGSGAAGPRRVDELVQRRSPPQAQRLAQAVAGGGRVAVGEHRPPLVGEHPELPEVDVGGVDLQAVAAAAKGQRRRAERAPQPRHVALQRAGGRRRRVVAPEVGDDRGDGHGASGGEQQRDEQRPRLRAADVDDLIEVVTDLEGAQHTEPHASLPRPAPAVSHRAQSPAATPAGQ